MGAFLAREKEYQVDLERESSHERMVVASLQSVTLAVAISSTCGAVSLNWGYIFRGWWRRRTLQVAGRLIV
jgi:hypothetical protein